MKIPKEIKNKKNSGSSKRKKQTKEHLTEADYEKLLLSGDPITKGIYKIHILHPDIYKNNSSIFDVKKNKRNKVRKKGFLENSRKLNKNW